MTECRPGGRTPARQTLREKALALLARREHSRFELAAKLAQADFLPEDIEPLLDEFAQKNWLSDQRYAESYVADHRSRYGERKLAHELRQRGISEELIRAALATTPESELERARSIWLKKFSQPPEDAREAAKQYRFMLGRGFSQQTISKLLKS